MVLLQKEKRMANPNTNKSHQRNNPPHQLLHYHQQDSSLLPHPKIRNTHPRPSQLAHLLRTYQQPTLRTRILHRRLQRTRHAHYTATIYFRSSTLPLPTPCITTRKENSIHRRTIIPIFAYHYVLRITQLPRSRTTLLHHRSKLLL